MATIDITRVRSAWREAAPVAAPFAFYGLIWALVALSVEG